MPRGPDERPARCAGPGCDRRTSWVCRKLPAPSERRSLRRTRLDETLVRQIAGFHRRCRAAAVQSAAGGLIGLLIGHAFDTDWFRLRRGNNPYAVLGLTDEASDAEIDRAYRRLISQYHPDRMAGAAEELRRQAEAKAREINAAYDRIQTLRRK
jgi:DnaJ-domain-containing protein 1